MMGSCESWDNYDGHVERIMGETRKEGKEYNLNLSCRFGIAKFLRRRHEKTIMGQVRKLVSIEIPGKIVVSSEEIVSNFEDE